MRIQSINTDMINKTYQTNNQTIPMVKTNNVNLSPVCDNNITYSLYGNNSSGTVAFGKGNAIVRKGNEIVMKRINALHKKVASASSFTPLRTLIELECINGTKMFPYKDTYEAFDHFSYTIRDLLNNKYKRLNESQVLRYGAQLIEAAGMDGAKIFKVPSKLTFDDGFDKSGDYLIRMFLDSISTFDRCKSREKALELIPKLREVTRADGNTRLIGSNVDIVKSACMLADSETPEKSFEYFNKLAKIDKNGHALFVSKLSEFAIDIAQSKSPKKAIKLVPKLLELNREEDIIYAAIKLAECKSPQNALKIMQKLKTPEGACHRLFRYNYPHHIVEEKYLVDTTYKLANSEAPSEKVLALIPELSEIENGGSGYNYLFEYDSDEFANAIIKFAKLKSPEKAVEFLSELIAHRHVDEPASVCKVAAKLADSKSPKKAFDIYRQMERPRYAEDEKIFDLIEKLENGELSQETVDSNIAFLNKYFKKVIR